MPVLPGPCGLHRCKEFGALEEGVMHQHFSLVNKQVDSVIFGNVQLAEDRIPSWLLVFRDGGGSKTADKDHKPRTGFVHDAIFYFEAEKPLGQLVKQRRRWINGTFAAYLLWVVHEGWIWRGNHSLFVKLFATLFVFINLIQGVSIRLFGPSSLAIGLYTACLVLPLLLSNTPEQTLDMLYNFETSEDASRGVRSMAALVTAAYVIIYALFMIGHTPRAVPIKEGALKGRWRSDKSSAYRPWLFVLGFFTNAISVMLLLMMGGIIFAHVGWAATPLAFRLVVLFSVVPYGIALMDGLINSRFLNVTSLLTLLWATPCYILASIWFSVWFPAYATARISDLSWGNRDNGGEDQSSEVAKHRANVGKVMTLTLISSNILATGSALALQSVVTGALQVVLLTCIGVMSIHFGVAGVDISIRFFNKLSFLVMCWCCIPGFNGIHEEEEEEEEEKNKPTSESTTMATTVSGDNVDIDFSV
jgi:cellulose synthase/poly-beta-1,6-N-acetylglucosamine synthase-like glycosyltransferase